MCFQALSESSDSEEEDGAKKAEVKKEIKEEAPNQNGVEITIQVKTLLNVSIVDELRVNVYECR